MEGSEDTMAPRLRAHVSSEGSLSAALMILLLVPALQVMEGCVPPKPVEEEFIPNFDDDPEEDAGTIVAPTDTGGVTGFDLGGGTADTGPTVKPPKDAGTTTSSKDTAKVDAKVEPSDTASSADAFSCVPDEKTCAGNTVRTCNSKGDGYTQDIQNCGISLCEKGLCQAGKVCKEGAQFCEGTVAFQCSKDGAKKIQVKQCEKDEVCKMVDFGGASAPECVPQVCVPSQKTCSGTYDAKAHSFSGDVLVECSSDGTAKKSSGKDCTKDGKICVIDVDGVATCELPTCGDGKVHTDGGEQCDLGIDAAGKKKNGLPGTICTSKCKVVDNKCSTTAECKKMNPGPCDAGFTCNLNLKVCVAVPKPTGQCDDGNPCTKGDKCIVGECFGIENPCDDGNKCTTDSCDPTSGCVHSALTGPACSDGLTCTVGDKCDNGVCTAGLNACQCTSANDCAKFEDGNPCTGTLLCFNNTCVVNKKTLVKCEGGTCIDTAKTNPSACKAAAKMWVGGANGKCYDPLTNYPDKNQENCLKVGSSWLSDSACHTAKCSKSYGVCQINVKYNGATCDDSNACTTEDQCFGGLCEGSKASCDDGNACTKDMCQKQTGCINAPLGGAPCNDGDECTKFDQCKGSQCKGTPSCKCQQDSDCAAENPKNPCKGKYICNKAINVCKLDPASVVYCDPAKGKPCAPYTCDENTAQCKTLFSKEGAKCNDGDACTKDDVCGAGKAKGECKGVVNTCQDGNFCTTDKCEPKAGCVNYYNANPCDDGNPCTKDDKCIDSVCSPGLNQCECFSDLACTKYNGANKCYGTYKCNKVINQCHFDPKTVVKCGTGVCSDPNKNDKATCESAGGIWSTDDDCGYTECNGSVGKCEKITLKDGANCDDGNPCTVPDACKAGKCSSKAKKCDDDNSCTQDSCDPKAPIGCLYKTKPMNNKVCEDGNVCTGGDACNDGTCESGKKTAKSCDDGNSCTADGCDPSLGCFNLPYKKPCDDGNLCTGTTVGLGVVVKANLVVDMCDDKGVCKAGTPRICNDGNGCTTEKCKPKGWLNTNVAGSKPQSCEFVYLSKDVTCTSGDKCTENDFCLNGTCSGVGTKVNCDDGNVCSEDTCAPAPGCKHGANDKDCDDGNTCTIEDKCLGKSCFTQKTLNCDDENLCTNDSCDPKAGCKYSVNKAASSCGDFAKCSTGAKPKCEFVGGAHLVISEIYVGDPIDPSDSFVEIYNPTKKSPELTDYEIQWRPANSDKLADWKPLAQMEKKKIVILPTKGYVLFGHSGPVPGNVALDVKDAKNFKLDPKSMQVRLFDKKHTLTHDVVVWGKGKDLVKVEGDPLQPWFSAHSVERKASKDSKAKSMVMAGFEWYGGNGWDTDENTKDFVVRDSPDPQAQSQGLTYEPACKLKCSEDKVCDFQGAGKDKCVIDSKCAIGCGSGHNCQSSLGLCVPHFANKVVISEILVGTSTESKSEYIEIYNMGKTDIDITGFMIQVKDKDALPSAPWKTVVQLPAKVVLPAKHFWAVTTQEWAAKHGPGDAVVKAETIDFGPLGGAVRIWSPRTHVELDKMGWGSAKEYSNGGAFQTKGLPQGYALTRKAFKAATGMSMASHGVDALKGHGFDSDVAEDDFVVVDTPTPSSLRSGRFAPACNGKCAKGKVCNYITGKDACVDPTCGGKCKSGAVCNIKTGACDLTLLISQYAPAGPSAFGISGKKEIKLAKSYNEFVELYNPGDAPVNIEDMLIQVLIPGLLGWKTRTQIFKDHCMSDKNKNKCAGPSEKCHCQNDHERDPKTGAFIKDSQGLYVAKQCVFDTHCLTTTIAPKQYLLIAPPIFDKKLPKPQWVANVQWNFCKDLPKQDLAKPECNLMRKPWASATKEQMEDPLHPAYYGGNSLKTDGMDSKTDCQQDWVMICPRRPRNAYSPPQGP
jgi:hypothetical protein